MTTPSHDILSLLENIKSSGNSHSAKCPNHPDKRNSLSIKYCPDGRILIKCHAGCKTEDIVSSLGLKMAELFSTPQKQATENHSYVYLDASGNHLMRVVRYAGEKSFFQQRPDGKGGWVNGLKGAKRVPYNLPNVLVALREGKPIFIVEGEKDCESLGQLGITATTNSGGAGKWRPEYSSFFQEAHVVILPDNDPPGVAHAEDVAESLEGIAASIKLVSLPGLQNKQDITDWLEKGHTKEELTRLIQATSCFYSASNVVAPEHEASQIPDHVYKMLPPTIEIATSFFERRHEKDMFLTGLLGAISGALPNIDLRYGGHKQGTNLYVLIDGPPGSGKSVVRHAFKWLKKVDKQLLSESQTQRDEWDAEKRSRDRKDRNNQYDHAETSEVPLGKRPPERCLTIAANTTAAALSERLADNPNGGVMLATEMDSLSSSNRREHGDFSYILRQAFQHEEIQVDRKLSDSIRIESPRLSVVLTGTNDQVNRLLTGGAEDGLLSRFIIYSPEAKPEFFSQRPCETDKKLDTYTLESSEKILSIYNTLLKRGSDLKIVVTDSDWDFLDDCFGAFHTELLANKGQKYLAVCNRGALLSMRIASILCIIESFDDGVNLAEASGIKLSRNDLVSGIELGLFYAHQTLQTAIKLESTAIRSTTVVQREFSAALPSNFSKSEFEIIAERFDIPKGSQSRIIDLMIKHGEIERFKHGQYKKTTADIAKLSYDHIDFFEHIDHKVDGNSPEFKRSPKPSPSSFGEA